MEKKTRYICLVRASDASEGTTSTEAQLAYLKEYGQRTGLSYVDAVVLDGVTGSLPGKREDLQGLLTRKRDRDDFDLVLVQRLDRLTRGGSAHGFWFEHEAKRVGLKLVFVGDDIPDGRYANLIKVAKYEAAQEQAFSISQRSAQGSQLAMEDGRNVTSSHTPYGCWRMYLTADAKPSHIIADSGDGRQQKLDPQTFAVIDTYGQVGGGSKGHYRKQKNERVLLMPGFAEEATVVREIFTFHFSQGWGGKRIADALNQRGVPSPQGRQWSQHQVEVIYEQEAYTGRSVGNRTSSAIYHERSASAPKRVELDGEVQATAKNIPVRQRPRSEWFIQDQPLMADFLGDPSLCDRAKAEHEQIWSHRWDVDRVKQSKSRHTGSDYVLTGLLRAKQDGEPLVGVLCGRVGKKVRYYRHRRGRRGYVKGSVFNRMVSAQPLEAAVVDLISRVLTSDEDCLRDRITRLIETTAAQTGPTEQLAELRQRRERVRSKTDLIVSSLDEETLADAQHQLDRLRVERRSLDEQIAAAEGAAALGSVNVNAVADAVLTQLRQMTANVAQMPPFAVRELIGTVVSGVVIDMETRAAEIELMLPLGLTAATTGGEQAVRLVGRSASSTSDQTHPTVRVAMGRFGCTEERLAGRPCYVCRRRHAA
jgi:DNA invertase Pin-like site-specific DNA recombinase